MLNTPSICEDRVTTSHRAKLAYIYVRQSTAGQVRQHQESTELQYRLVDRAILFGWPKERVEVIDDDLGKDHGAAFVAGVDQLEEQVAAALDDRQAYEIARNSDPL